MSLSKRLFTYIQSQHISINAFEKKIGVSQGLIAKAIKNNTSIGSDKLCKIFQSFPGINLHWLITGDGFMDLKQYRTEKSGANIANDNRQEHYGGEVAHLHNEVIRRYERDIKRYLKEIDMLLEHIEDLKKNK